MHRQRSATITFGFVILMLAALACTCGPLSQAQEIAATGQAAATQVSDIVDEATLMAPTINAGLTQIAATGDAAAGQVGPELTAAVMTATALGPSTGGAESTPQPTAVQEGNTVTQWATGATASSQFGDISWAAYQASGEPDTPACGDHGSAWASNSYNEIAELTLTYDVPVIPTQINIYETFNPDAVSKVEVVSTSGERFTVYEGTPELMGNPADCPFVLEIPVSGVSALINSVIITVDQTNHPSWNEIDAVQLIGSLE